LVVRGVTASGGRPHDIDGIARSDVVVGLEITGEGEVVRVSSHGEVVLGAGDCAGFAAGVADSHHIQNRSKGDAVLLEIGSRCPGEDACCYPDNGVIVEPGLKVRPYGDGLMTKPGERCDPFQGLGSSGLLPARFHHLATGPD
jgi:hypothetical protein